MNILAVVLIVFQLAVLLVILSLAWKAEGRVTAFNAKQREDRLSGYDAFRLDFGHPVPWSMFKLIWLLFWTQLIALTIGLGVLLPWVAQQIGMDFNDAMKSPPFFATYTPLTVMGLAVVIGVFSARRLKRPNIDTKILACMGLGAAGLLFVITAAVALLGK